MKAIEIRARKHFRGVMDGTIKPRLLATPSEEDPWHVCLGGEWSIPLAGYYECQIWENRAEARRLVRAPSRPNPFFPDTASETEVPTEISTDELVLPGEDLTTRAPKA